jgi:hypothetical protein
MEKKELSRLRLSPQGKEFEICVKSHHRRRIGSRISQSNTGVQTDKVFEHAIVYLGTIIQ